MDRLYSLYDKADYRLISACLEDRFRSLISFRKAVFHKLEKRIISEGGKFLNRGFGVKAMIARNVRIFNDGHGNIRLDKRTLPKDLKNWIDCPYEIEWHLSKEEKAIVLKNECRAILSYYITDGTYEYPNDCDFLCAFDAVCYYQHNMA